MLTMAGSTEKHGTVLFCDLQDACVLVEVLEPRVLVRALQRFLTDVSDAVVDDGGTVITCMGYGALAMFESAPSAVAAAREIATERLPGFNAWLAHRGLERRFDVAAGIASGRVVVADLRAGDRGTVAAVGRATHTAARLTDLAKVIGQPVLAAGSTEALVQPDVLEFVGRYALRGQPEPTDVWAPAPRERRDGYRTHRSGDAREPALACR